MHPHLYFLRYFIYCCIMPSRCVFILLILFAAWQSQAQLSNLRTKKISARGSVQLDSASIVPGTFVCVEADSSFYSLDWVNALLVWKKKFYTDSITISYRTFPQKLNAVSGLYVYDSIKNNFIVNPQSNKEAKTDGSDFINFGKLNYSGSIGRNLTIGNNQDAVVNSQLNMQLSGYIGDSILLSAALTDNNIPIQPEGTTQQLNEFDRVLLTFSKKNWQIDLGDIDMRQDKNYFLNFYKRLQGISYRQQFTVNENVNITSVNAGAVAKGKFARNVFSGLEGNQGPYRLQGAGNELFFIILAGTEKVFIDGVQLQRGENRDYVINYNTAEITFTPQQMINKDKRIQVEFEYADRNFLNSMLYTNNTIEVGKKLSFDVSAYSNIDAKNSPINQTLEGPQKLFLQNIGDSVQNAFYPVSALDTFSASGILYKKIDTVYTGGRDSIFVYSTNPDSAKYSLTFTEVGFNKGNYIPLYNAANGKVFQWVAPVSGVPQGSFEPAEFLVAPRKQQVISIGSTWMPDEKTIIKTEIGLSRFDVNTFSAKDKANDDGQAAKITVQRSFNMKALNKNLQSDVLAGYEWVNKNFRPVERLRAVEFTRDWGLPILPVSATEQLPSVSINIADEKNNSMLYRYTAYIRDDGFKGNRNEIMHHQNMHGFIWNNVFSYTSSRTPADKGFYLRPVIDVSKVISSLYNYTAGVNYALEHNEIKNMATDSVTPLSFAFETITAYLKSDQQKNNRWQFNFFTRVNKFPYSGNLLQTDRSNNYNVQADLLQNKNHKFRINATYRRLYVSQPLIINQQSDNSLLGRVEYLVNEWKGFLAGNALYETGSGQEQRRDFSYFEVPAGTGQYAWNDYNNDGIQQLNEFELALFPDQAKFIRIYTPTNEFIKTNYTQFNYSISLTPKLLFTQAKLNGAERFLSKFLFTSSLQTFKKQLANGKTLFDPFKGNINDTSLIALNYITGNTLSYNRFSTRWGADITNVSSFSKSLLTYGLETLKRNDWTVKARVNIQKVYTITLQQKFSSNSLSTPSFTNRNYNIQSLETSPQFTYTAGTKFRVNVSYDFSQQKNEAQYGGEKAVSNALMGEVKFNSFSNASLAGSLTFNNISFTGQTNTTISYIMLNGLLPGKNWLWGLSLTKRLINNLEITVDYNGRKPGNARTIHTGTMGVRALL